ncbi:DUF5684 domain-containing protein [Microbacterium sp. B19]|uniref:DUF5684 domain-containing protein n=1 Tax=Microbacterium sp. B19 TaxID=96765 RepID=UPI0004763B77|nr:DUF5684 domain-containing protein [Microbacterium sp. B19]
MNDSTEMLLGALSLVLFVILYVWHALALAAVFAKAGEASWKGWVPVLNVATVLKLGGFSPWLVLIVLVPVFGVIAYAVVSIVAIHRVNLAFGRGAGMTVLGAFLPIIWASILGFGRARWEGAAPGARRSGVDENSAPVRRGQDFAGPYVPLVGGWTPEPPKAETGVAVAEDEGRDAAPSTPVSEPVVLPFAAPSPSLSDAVPTPSDWAPPAAGGAAGFLPPANADDDAAWKPESLAPATPVRRRSEPTVDAEDPAATSAPAAAPATPAADESPLDPWLAPARSEPAPEASTPLPDAPLTRPAPATVPVSAVPAVPARREEPGEEFPELSEAVSAVAEAPQAGAPRSARTSVSALYTQPEFPAEPEDAELDALDRTVVTRRRRIPWAIVPPNGVPVDLTSDVVILGRRPAPDAAHPDAQLIAIVDETRTVSKTHARLQLRGEKWFVTDLDSTNGVLFATLMGTEVEAPPGEEIEAGERFFLGDAEVRLTRREA